MQPLRGTSRRVLDGVAADESFSWDDRWLITQAIDHICLDVETADLKMGPPRLGVRRLIFEIPDTQPPIAITFEFYRPELYPEGTSGIYIQDISRIA